MYKKMQEIKESIIGNLIECIIVSFTVCVVFQLTTSNILYLLVGVLYAIVHYLSVVALDKREKWVVLVLSSLFSIFMVYGNLETVLTVDFIPIWPVTVLLCLLGFYFCFSLIIGHVLVFVRKIEIISSEKNKKHRFVVFWISLVALLLMWGVGLAFSYPGNTTSDSTAIIRAAIGESELRADVPIIYVFAIRFFWNLGIGLFRNPNAAMAVCAIAHMLLLSLIVSYMLAKLYVNGVKKSVCVIIWLFYALVPYNVQLSHTLWKDIPFSAFVFLFMIFIWDYFLVEEEKTKISTCAQWIVFIISGIGMCLMRNNGLFAYLFFLPFGLYISFKKHKSVFVALICILVITRIIQGPVYDKLMTENARAMNETAEKLEKSEGTKGKTDKVVKNATDNYNASAIYIMTVQQFAKVAVNGTDLSVEEYERLNNIIDIEKVCAHYDPYCIDSSMSALKFGMSKAKYLKEWLHFGIKYPIQYALAWRDQTYGYWYPDIQYWVYTDQIRENELGIYKDSVLSEETRYNMLKAEEAYKEIPIYGMFWSIGFVVWIMLFSAGIAAIKKGMRGFLVYFPILGVWGTLILATPVYAEFRYIYAMFLCLPLMVLIPFINGEDEDLKSKPIVIEQD